MSVLNETMRVKSKTNPSSADDWSVL